MLRDSQFPKQGFSLFTYSLKYNTMLKDLTLFHCGPGSMFFTSLKKGLWANQMLTKLLVGTDPLPEKEGVDLVATVRNNYGLKICTICVANSNQGSFFCRCIPFLNKLG